MNLTKIDLLAAFKYGLSVLLFSSSFAFAQGQTAVGVFSVGITLNRDATVPAGSCITQTLFNQTGAVVRVTCVDNPFVNIAPSIDLQLPGTFGKTFRYPLYSNPSNLNSATADIDRFKFALYRQNSAYLLSLKSANTTQLESSIQDTSGNLVGSNFTSPTSTVTDFSIYRTGPETITDSQGLMDMVISF